MTEQNPILEIKGHDVEVTEALRNHINNKIVQHIGKKFNNITTVHVTLTVAKKFQQKAEAEIHLAGTSKPLFASSESADMYASIDLLSDKITRQVQKHKEMLKNHGDAG